MNSAGAKCSHSVPSMCMSQMTRSHLPVLPAIGEKRPVFTGGLPITRPGGGIVLQTDKSATVGFQHTKRCIEVEIRDCPCVAEPRAKEESGWEGEVDQPQVPVTGWARDPSATKATRLVTCIRIYSRGTSQCCCLESTTMLTKPIVAVSDETPDINLDTHDRDGLRNFSRPMCFGVRQCKNPADRQNLMRARTVVGSVGAAQFADNDLNRNQCAH